MSQPLLSGVPTETTPQPFLQGQACAVLSQCGPRLSEPPGFILVPPEGVSATGSTHLPWQVFLSGLLKNKVLWQHLIFSFFFFFFSFLWRRNTVYQSLREAQDLPLRALCGQLKMTVTPCSCLLSKLGLVSHTHLLLQMSMSELTARF